METTVTKPIEDIINTVSGIDELRSTTTEGVSIVTVQFLLSKNGDVGMQEVRDKVNTILADLPDGTDPPIVDKFDTELDARHDDRRLGPARLPRGHRAGSQADQGAARNGQRRRLDQPGRRPGARDERGPRHRTPGRLQPLGRRRAVGPGAAEPRGPRRPHRSRVARARAPHAGPAPDRERVQRPDRRQSQRLPDPRPRHRPRRRCLRGAADAGAARRRQRRQPGGPEAVGRQHRQGRRGRQGPPRSAQGRASRPTSPPRSSATSRGSSRSRSRRSSSTCCWPPSWCRPRSCSSSATGGRP